MRTFRALYPAVMSVSVAVAQCAGSAGSAQPTMPDATVARDVATTQPPRDVPRVTDVPLSDVEPEGGCETDQDCTGGDFCNGTLVCTSAHQCGYALVHDPCNDGQPCTDDDCNSAERSCTYVPHNDRCPAGDICETFVGCVPPDGG